MRIRIQKWGDSLGLQIPKSYAAQTALHSGTEVDLSIEDGRLVITPVTAGVYQLTELLSHVSAENLHSEIETGSSIASEVW